jgi:hypothetical protein
MKESKEALETKLDQNRRAIKQLELEKVAVRSLSVEFADQGDELGIKIEGLQTLGAVLEAEIAACVEVTYSIGDRFNDDEYMIVCVEDYKVTVCNRETGSNCGNVTKVGDCRYISEADYASMIETQYLDDIARTWDARKQCEV